MAATLSNVDEHPWNQILKKKKSSKREWEIRCHLFMLFPNEGLMVSWEFSFHKLCAHVHWNKTKFERSSSLKYYHMIYMEKTKHTSFKSLFHVLGYIHTPWKHPVRHEEQRPGAAQDVHTHWTSCQRGWPRMFGARHLISALTLELEKKHLFLSFPTNAWILRLRNS